MKMENKVCLVTGANAGLGKAVCLGLAKAGATVVMVSRSRERGEAALAEVRQESGNDRAALLLADLASQAAIRHLVDRFKESYSALHVLINNAAVVPQNRTVTEAGLEMQLAVNHLAPFLLTNLLLDRLKAGAPARIITASSQTHRGATIDFDDLQSEQNYSHTRVYAETKLANVLFTYELARRLTGSDVTANCMHPGVMSTNLLDAYMGRSGRKKPERGVDTSVVQGAEALLYLASAPELAEVSGQYFRLKNPVDSADISYDEEIARRLWQVSARLTGLTG